LLPLLSFIHLRYTYNVVTGKQELDTYVVEHGHSTNYKCGIYNEGILSTSILKINFLFNDNMFKDQMEPKTFALNSKKTEFFVYRLICRYRGIYSVGIDTMEICDILNIFRIKIRNMERKSITILPKVTMLTSFYAAEKLESNISTAFTTSAKDANSLVDVRKFEEGDALKHVHWKLSAKHDELLVKALERSVLNSTLVFLDTYEGNHDFGKKIALEDKLMEALVSIVNQRLIKNHNVEINYYEYGYKTATYTRQEDFRDFYTQIAEVMFTHIKDIQSFMDDYFQYYSNRHSLYGKDLFIFTCNLEEINVEALTQYSRGINCTLYIVSCSMDQTDAGAFKTRDGTYYYKLTPSSDLQVVFAGSTK